jgi:hypothetical protein
MSATEEWKPTTPWKFELEPFVDEEPDETSFNLRHYLDLMPDEKMRQYSSSWPDERVVEWCGDFTNEGALLLPCSEREVDVVEFRRVLDQALAYRERARGRQSEQ